MVEEGGGGRARGRRLGGISHAIEKTGPAEVARLTKDRAQRATMLLVVEAYQRLASTIDSSGTPARVLSGEPINLD